MSVLPNSLVRTLVRRSADAVVWGVEGEVLRELPQALVSAYEELLARSRSRPLPHDVGVVAKTRRVVRISTSQRETRGGAKGSRKAGPSDPIRDPAALVFKGKVDRKLRKLAREMRVWLDGGVAHNSVRRCTRCRRFADETWLYCPHDGARTEEVDV